MTIGSAIILLLNLMIGAAITFGFGYWGLRVRREYHSGLGTAMLILAGIGVVYLLMAFLTAG